jgi:hypothetical protein
VDHRVHPVQSRGRQLPNVARHELDAVEQGVKRLLPPVQAVHDPNLIVAGHEPLDQNATDVAGATGDQHGGAPLGRIDGQAVRAGVAPGKPWLLGRFGHPGRR